MDRLIEVDRKGTAGAADEPIARYRYNVFGERIAKLVYTSGGKQAKVSYFFYDGSELSAEADESGAVTRDYVYIESRPVAMLEGRAVLAIHTDDRLAPLAVTDKDRHVVWQAKVGENGEAAVASGSTIDMPLRGSNQYFDPETGLHYNLNRYLDANTGRYISPDPMGLAAGPDLYRFALGQPHRFIDPLGLAPVANQDISNLGFGDKLVEVIQLAIPKLPAEVGNELRAMVSPENIGTTIAVLGLWAASHAFGVGEVVDAAMVGLARLMLGKAAVDLIVGLINTTISINSAKCSADLDSAATTLANAFSKALTGAAQGLLLRSLMSNAVKEMGAATLQRLKNIFGDGKAGSIRNANVLGGDMNCVNCVVATDATLNGRAASALPGGPYRINVLEKLYGKKFGRAGSLADIESAMLAAGPGASAIVYASRGPGEVGHVVNVVNQKGVIRFLDGQIGGQAKWAGQGYISFSLLRTN